MPIPSTKVSIQKVQSNDRNFNQAQQNIIDGINKLQSQVMLLSTVVGESRSAYLSEDQFQQQAGDNWVLQDGRSCIGTAYETLTGNRNVPNACGRALRMADNGQGVNPDGDLDLGTNQNDAFASHLHAIQTHVAGTNGSFLGYGDTAAAGAQDSASTGGNETRMKNTTVNFFIRIN